MANAEVGVHVNSPFAGELIGNSLIGNGVAGIRFAPSHEMKVIHGGNIFGNGEAALGCGLINETGNVIDASDNYSGKANGPGPNPGDRAFGDCQVSGSTLTTPFATVPFPAGEGT